MLCHVIPQVQNIHTQSVNMSRGIRTPSPSTSAQMIPGYPYSSMVGPAHSRSDSLPAEAYLTSKTPSPPGVSPLVIRKVYSPTHNSVVTPSPPKHHGSEELLSPTPNHLDPMVEFDPSKLSWNDSNAYPEMHRLSVAW